MGSEKADGLIIIDTQIDTKGVKVGAKQIEASTKRLASTVNDLGKSAKLALNEQQTAIAEMKTAYSEQEKIVRSLESEVRKYATSEYAEVSKQIDKANEKLRLLKIVQDEFVKAGGEKDSDYYQEQQKQICILTDSISKLKLQLEDLETSGRAIRIDVDTTQANQAVNELTAAREKLKQMGMDSNGME